MPEVTDPNLLAKLNGGAAPRGAPQPVLSIPDRPEKPTEPKTSWRTMTPDEAQAQGLPENGVYQVSSQGEIRAVKTPPEKTDPSTPQGRRDIALSVLGAAGIDLRGGKDPVADLIRGSTSGGLQTWAARKYGSLTGSSTDGMMKIAQLETIGNDIVLKASGGSLGAQLSNPDREFMTARFGDIANPEKTVDERLAAWEQVKQRLGYDAGIEMGAPTGQPGTVAPPGGGPGGTVNPTMRGGLPVGTQITFDGQGGPQWWDRNQWLMETRGITPDQESQIVGFWNANRGNQGITPEGVFAWYDQMGIPRPSEQEVMQGVQYARAGTVEFGAFDDSDAKAARAAQLQGMVQQDSAVRNFGAEYDPNSARSYLDTLTEAPLAGFADELSGLSGAIVGGLSGENPVTAYLDARDASQFRDEMNRNAQGIPGEALRLVGSLPTAMSLPGAYSPTVGGAVKAGASYGALAGAGEGRGFEGTIKGAAGGAALGGAVGGATAGAGQWAVNKLAQRSAARGPTMTAAERYARGQQFGVDLSPGDAGGMSAKVVERGLDYQPVSASIMDEARNVKAAQIETAVGNVADTFGRPTTLRGIGETAQRGARNWMDESEKVVSKLYEAIPIAPEASAATPNTVARLTDLTSKFSSNPKLAAQLEDKRLSGYLDALTAKARQVPTGILDDAGNPITREVTEGGGLSWQDLKDLRSRIGEEIGQQMFGEKTLKSDLRSLYGALSSDMEATAARQGEGALKAFKRANTQAKSRFDRIEAVIEPLLGKGGDNTPEAAAQLIQRISQGGKSTTDLKMLAQVRKTLKPDEWGQVQNGLVRIMGQPAKSEGRAFAPETFVRVYSDLDKGAKNILFGTGDLRKNLDEFVEVISDVARNDGARNTSHTANGVVGALTLSPAFYTGGLPGVMAQTAMSFATAKVMTNPAAVRWLTGYSKMIRAAGKSGTVNPKAHAGQLAALGRLASAHPSVAQEATALQRELQGLFAGSGSQAAAEGDNRPKAKPTTMPVPK